MRWSIFPVLALAAGCDLSGDFLFPGAVDNVPGVLIVEAPDGGTLHQPAAVTNYEAVQAATVYFELGPTGTAALGGATMDFVGTGGRVCVWVDPETTSWNQAIREGVDPFLRPFTYPDNVFDDGDIDVIGGRSVFYTGSPGVSMGDFVLQYEDDLGNPVPISFVECAPLISQFDSQNTHAGKGAAEYCEFASTEIGVTYTVALQTWSTPLDDDRVGMGVILSQGSCSDLIRFADADLEFNNGTLENQQIECVVRGESIQPDPNDAGPWFGYEAVEGLAWEDSIAFEDSFCFAGGARRLDEFCELEGAGLRQLTDEEIDELDADELDDLATSQTCEWTEVTEDGNRCFCGDPRDTPQQGAG